MPIPRSRWEGRLLVLQKQLAYILTALGAFALGVSAGVWLTTGSGSTSARVASPPLTPVIAAAVLPAESSRQPSPVSVSTAAPSPLAEYEIEVVPSALIPGAADLQPTPAAPTPPVDPRVRPGAIKAPEGFTGATMRADPSTSGTSIRVLANGTRVDVLPDTRQADDYLWVRLRTLDGAVGWVVSVALE